MERLIKISQQRIKVIKGDFVRYLHDEIDWNSRLSIITGARGVGKTTLLLQQLKTTTAQSIYLSLDDFYFEQNRLLLLVEDLYEKGYRNFYLDEVHQYPYWSADLKNMYDNLHDAKFVATGSSVLKINQGQADLSRRANNYILKGLSFREFLALHYNKNFPVLPLEEILHHHHQLSPNLNDAFDSLKLFKQYLSIGYYPFSKEEHSFFHQKLQQILQLITEVDIPNVEAINYSTIRSLRKLLYIISQSVPFTPNIQSLSEKVGIPRNSILKALDLLERGQIINLLRSQNKGVSYLQKPEKIYLENTNLAFTLAGDTPNAGNLRETFFFNQMSVKHDVSSSRFGDFMINNTYTFEIGGAGKTSRQIKGIPLSFMAADGIKNGESNKIPLWLFGFLY
ncbi:MAG: ATP-binding protein [Chitinophagaceae bacterium]|nr:ATP-binding protein [Chitinophagaceae bacterium]